MPKYITVLSSQQAQSRWKAVQWDEDLASIRDNSFYSADVNMSVAKDSDDVVVGNKTITEINTQRPASAVIIKLGTANLNLMKVASNTATKAFLKKKLQ